MVNTNSKEFRDKVQAHIRYMMKGRGGITAMVHQIDSLMNDKNANGRREYPTPYHAAYYMVEGAYFLAYNSDILEEMHRWGLTDDKRLLKWRNWKGQTGPFYLYAHIMASNVERMYEQAKKPRMVKKVVKKTTKAKARK